MRDLLTREEVDSLLPRLEGEIEQLEAEDEALRPLPPMTPLECLEYFSRLMETARGRPLTRRETILHGQLLSVYQSAVRAECLGRRGRFFVLSEADVLEAAKKHGIG